MAFARDESGAEYVVLGKGVGFSGKSGQEIDEKNIERSFRAENVDEHGRSFASMFGSVFGIEKDILKLVHHIVKMAELRLNVEFDEYRYIILADHISFAIKRAEEGLIYDSMEFWRFRQLYPKEYELAEDVLAYLNENLDVELDRSELSFLTYHFVNANAENINISDTINMTKLLRRIIELVEYHFQMELNEETFSYNRFVNHLRYFITRRFNDVAIYENEVDDSIKKMVAMKYPKESEVSEKIAALLKQKEGWTLSSDERLYLSLHICRVVSETAGTKGEGDDQN